MKQRGGDGEVDDDGERGVVGKTSIGGVMGVGVQMRWRVIWGGGECGMYVVRGAELRKERKRRDEEKGEGEKKSAHVNKCSTSSRVNVHQSTWPPFQKNGMRS